MAGTELFSVLFVCTGNVCRSPMAERLTVARLPAAARGVSVRSAGTSGWDGAPMQPNAAAVLVERGADPTGFVARALTADLVGAADLVLCAAREHRAAVVTLHPPAVRRCFTVREFARLLDGVPPAAVPGEAPAERGRALVAVAGGRRGVVPPVPAAADAIPDPLGAAVPAFRACADLLEASLAVPLNLLAP